MQATFRKLLWQRYTHPPSSLSPPSLPHSSPPADCWSLSTPFCPPQLRRSSLTSTLPYRYALPPSLLPSLPLCFPPSSLSSPSLCLPLFSLWKHFIYNSYKNWTVGRPGNISFPGLPTVQFLITCSMQNQRRKAWYHLSHE